MRKIFISFLVLVVVISGLVFGAPSGCSAQMTSQLEYSEMLYDRVVFLGASASSGHKLGMGVSLASLFESSLAVRRYNFSDFSTGKFFGLATAERSSLVDEALTRKPTLVVAVDFLFWFAHGVPSSDESRRAAMDEGLRLLERFTCPLVIGDIPDVSAAQSQVPMLRFVMPAPATRAWANQRIADWVSSRNLTSPTLLVPLAQAMVRQLAGEPLRIGKRQYATTGLLQEDLLHPTLEGERILVRLVQQALTDASLARPSDFK